MIRRLRQKKGGGREEGGGEGKGDERSRRDGEVRLKKKIKSENE